MRVARGRAARPRWRDGDGNSNSLLPPVKYNSRAHSRLDNPCSLCMKTYYAAGSSVRTEPLSALLFPPVLLSLSFSLLFSVEHDKSNYTFKLRYTILSPSFSFLSLLTASLRSLLRVSTCTRLPHPRCISARFIQVSKFSLGPSCYVLSLLFHSLLHDAFVSRLVARRAFFPSPCFSLSPTASPPLSLSLHPLRCHHWRSSNDRRLFSYLPRHCSSLDLSTPF